VNRTLRIRYNMFKKFWKNARKYCKFANFKIYRNDYENAPKNGKCAQHIVFKFWKYHENSWNFSNFENAAKILEKFENNFENSKILKMTKFFWKFSKKIIFSKNYECAQNWKLKKKLIIFPKNFENFLILKMCSKNWKMWTKNIENFENMFKKFWKFAKHV
jgi:hypothetical protein